MKTNTISENLKIDFIGIGAPKSGTTWISRCLEEHPEVNFSKIKETRYFLTEKALTRRQLGNKRFNYDIAKYLNYFNWDKKGKTGEFTPDYLYDINTPMLIKKYFSQVKLITCLRNPVDLIYSIYWFNRASFSRSQIPDTFEEALEDEKIYKELGLFYKYLKNYYDIFPEKNIHIIIFDDIKKNNKQVLKELYRFIGVDDNFVPINYLQKANKTKQIRSAGLTHLNRAVIKTFTILKLDRFLTTKGLMHRIYSQINKKPFDYPTMKADTRERLKKMFRYDVENLEKLIGKKLNQWK